MADAWYSALDVVLPGLILGANGAGADEKEELQRQIWASCSLSFLGSVEVIHAEKLLHKDILFKWSADHSTIRVIV